MDLIIIGCGSLGSFLTFNLLQHPNNNLINRIALVDYDVVDSKNFPYLCTSDYSKIGQSKVSVLKSELQRFHSTAKIETYSENYNDFINYNECDLLSFETTTIVDCRDTSEWDSTTSIKINYDWCYGRISFGNSSVQTVVDNKYGVGYSNFYSNYFTCKIAMILFNDISIDRRFDYVVNLKKDKMHAI